MRKRTAILAIITGGLIGAIFALLYAPRSGQETRQLLAEDSREIRETALNSIQKIQDSALMAVEKSLSSLETLNREISSRYPKKKGKEQITLQE